MSEQRWVIEIVDGIQLTDEGANSLRVAYVYKQTTRWPRVKTRAWIKHAASTDAELMQSIGHWFEAGAPSFDELKAKDQ